MPDLSLRSERLAISVQKPIAPYTLDPGLTFYCPQENVEAFSRPDIQAFLDYMRDEYQPPELGGQAIALLMPCTKTKPYVLSKEHLEINRYLLAMGFKPAGEPDYPPELLSALPDGYPSEALHNGPLVKGKATLHRLVVSEPMALVPYEHVYRWRGQLSLAARYDDPGLFEHRGTAVCLWRADQTAVGVGAGKYRWGQAERAAYAEIHNLISEQITAVLGRLRSKYVRIVAYLSPKMTHRSFVTSRAEKSEVGLPHFKTTAAGRAPLIGVNDRAPGLIDVSPNGDDLRAIKLELEQRLSKTGMLPASIRTYFASGGGGATPLILPESLAALARHLAI